MKVTSLWYFNTFVSINFSFIKLNIVWHKATCVEHTIMTTTVVDLLSKNKFTIYMRVLNVLMSPGGELQICIFCSMLSCDATQSMKKLWGTEGKSFFPNNGSQISQSAHPTAFTGKYSYMKNKNRTDISSKSDPASSSHKHFHIHKSTTSMN